MPKVQAARPIEVDEVGSIPLKNELATKQKKWDRTDILLRNDEDEIKTEFSQQLPNERDADFRRRKKTVPITFINQAQDLLSAPSNQIFRNGVDVDFKNKNSMLGTFSENVTRTNDAIPMLRYIRDYIAVGLRAYGTVFTIIDKPRIIPTNREDERNNGLPYLKNISPLNVLNYEFDDLGNLIWFAYKTTKSDPWIDPLSEKPPKINAVAIWDRNSFRLVNSKNDVIDRFNHNWGFVPVIIQGSFLPSPDDILGVAAFEQTSNLLIAGNHRLNIAYYELDKHGSALLLMPEMAIMGVNSGTDGDGETRMKTQNQNTTLNYAGDIEPSYLVKELVVEDHFKMSQWFFKTAVENERDLKSVIKNGADGDVQQSGISKIIDRDPLEVNLIGLAEDCEIWYDKVMDRVAKILRVENDASIEFDKDYDLATAKSTYEEIETAQNAGIGRMTKTGHKELWKKATPKITNDPELQEEINREIDEALTQDEIDDELQKRVDKEVNGMTAFEDDKNDKKNEEMVDNDEK